MLMRRSIVLLAFLAACGGKATPEWAGNWQTAAPVPGSYVSMALQGSGTSVSGNGTFHREAGVPTDFTVSGTPSAMVFPYPDNSTENFTATQPDADHLDLVSAGHTLDFNRQ